MNRKSISVIIPAYNVESYIGQCIESCIAQTYENTEIIIVNDGSTDNTQIIIDQYRNKYPEKIKVLITDNQGLSMARNNGFDISCGEYIYFLDSDDWIEPDTFDKCIEKIEKHDLDYVIFDSQFEFEIPIPYHTLRTLKLNIKNDKVYNNKELLDLFYDENRWSVAVWRKVFCRTFLFDNNIRFVKDLINEDNIYMFDILMCKGRLEYISNIFHHYRIRKNSIMNSLVTMPVIRSRFYIINYIIDRLPKDRKNLIDIIYNTVLNFLSFVTYYGHMSIDSKSIYENKEELLNLKIELIEKITNCFIQYAGNDEAFIALNHLVEFIAHSTGISMELCKLVDSYGEKSNKIRYNRLKSLPLSEKTKIGFYGTGLGATEILDMYEKLVGRINADIIFIDSCKESFRYNYRNKDIVNVHDLNGINIDYVIISSYKYREDMSKTLSELYVDRYTVFDFYKNAKCMMDIGGHLEFNETFKQLDINPKIILLATPQYYNIGDQLITVCETDFFKEKFPDKEIIEITSEEYNLYYLSIQKKIRPDDTIIVTGGGFLGSLWVNVLDMERLCREYPDNKIIVMPQSIYYEESDWGKSRLELDRRAFSTHKDLTIFFREKKSYDRFAELFPNALTKTYLVPDMALYKDLSSRQIERKYYVFCLRSDTEKIIDELFVDKLKSFFCDEDVIYTDMVESGFIRAEQRRTAVAEKLNLLKRSRLVITDRLHCMVACAITGTPCIAFDNLTGKVSGVYEWIKNLSYIKVFESADQMKDFNPIRWEALSRTNTFNIDLTGEFEKLADLIYELL